MTTEQAGAVSWLVGWDGMQNNHAAVYIGLTLQHSQQGVDCRR